MQEDILLYQIALTMIPGIGDVQGKKLVSCCKGVEGVFKEKKSNLLKISGIGRQLINDLHNKEAFVRAEKEISFIRKYQIKPLFYYDKDYPARLKHCHDSPLMLYFKGNGNLNNTIVLAVVGMRRPSEYGKIICEQIITGLHDLQLLIVSGLAYGIDACAHKASLGNNLETVAVLGHGLDQIYPNSNRPLAESIVHQGGLLTEFPSGTRLNKDLFPRRNRIVAGMSDAVLIIESAIKGGALITADLSLSYNRDVLAIPGRAHDKKSKGCNSLIKSNKAAMVESARDIKMTMLWDNLKQNKSRQTKLFINLSEDEKRIVELFSDGENMAIDEIYLKSGLPLSKVSSLLLNLEFAGVVQALPGKMFRLI